MIFKNDKNVKKLKVIKCYILLKWEFSNLKQIYGKHFTRKYSEICKFESNTGIFYTYILCRFGFLHVHDLRMRYNI